MALALTCTPTSPVAKSSFCRIDVDDALANDASAYTTTVYPTEPEIRYYLKFSVGGVEKGRSYVFAPNPYDGTHQFNNYIFPSSGSWTVALCKVSDNSEATTLGVTVS